MKMHKQFLLKKEWYNINSDAQQEINANDDIKMLYYLFNKQNYFNYLFIFEIQKRIYS